MKRVAIFMSDFHLGQNDQMEEFFADEEFAELLGRLSRHHQDDEVDLVLAGDVIDLWTTSLDPAEQHAETTKDITLRFPARTPEELKDAAKAETDKTRTIVKAHPLFFESLGRFLADAPGKRQIVYLPGNHDHSIVHKDLQAVIKKAIAITRIAPDEKFRATLESRISFPSYYQNDFLQVYAEHGNQFTYGGTFKYDNFGKFGEECPGYFQFKLVSNRLERQNPDLDGVFMEAFRPAMWPGIILWLFLKLRWKTFWSLRDYQTQFQYDDRKGPAFARTKLPPAWKSVLHLFKSNLLGLTKDEFCEAIPNLFDTSQHDVLPLSGKHLDPLKIKTVILGHSHQRREVPLLGLNGVTYYNTGGWIMRIENGRRVVEQTWVTISRDRADGQSSTRRVVLDREMVNRNVQKAEHSEGPVTTDGQRLNPTMRHMTDLRVGDVVLFRGNYGSMVQRMLRERRFGTLWRSFGDIIAGWFNRKGTNSPWNHVALIYASPSESQESDCYNDPLLLEAVPDVGVGIHGPKHYIEHPTDWDMAILRLKGGWLFEKKGNKDLGWERRRLLRRLALSQLQTHYDLNKIGSQTWLEAARSMDQRGKSVIGGLVKGALGGAAIGIGLLYYRSYRHVVDELLPMRSPDQSMISQVVEWCLQMRQNAIEFYDGIEFAPWLKWAKLEAILGRANDTQVQWVDIVMWFVATALILFMGYVAIKAITKAVFSIIIFYGGLLGGLIVPPLAELASGWSERTAATRWIMTVGWVGFYIFGPIYFWHLFVDPTSYFENGLLGNIVADGVISISPALWSGFHLFLLSWLAGTAVITACMPTAIKFVDNVCISIGRLAKYLFIDPWKQTVNRILQWLGRGRKLKEEVDVAVAPNFVCSTLVQYALTETAKQAEQEGIKGATADVDKDPTWKDYLPKHFAASDKFEWVYVLLDGMLIYRPSPAVRAQASPQRTDSDQARERSRYAQWAAVIGACAACAMLFAQFSKLSFCDGALLHCDTARSLIVWVPIWLGVNFAFLALFLARRAFRGMALAPSAMQGRALATWGYIFSCATLVCSLFVIWHDVVKQYPGDKPHKHVAIIP